jgi:GNAT superfamily N-acetyltransferase
MPARTPVSVRWRRRTSATGASTPAARAAHNDRVRIRPATLDDAEAIAAVHVRGWQWGYRGLLPDAYLAALSVDRRVEQWRSWLLDPGRTVTWVAEGEDARSVGFVATGPSRDPGADDETGEVYAIYVEEHGAGTGLGGALLQHAVQTLRDAGFARATLWVLDDNARARRFYEGAGWTPDGTTHSEPLEDFLMNETRYAIDL